MFCGTADRLTKLQQVKASHTAASPLRQHSTLVGRLFTFSQLAFHSAGHDTGRVVQSKKSAKCTRVVILFVIEF